MSKRVDRDSGHGGWPLEPPPALAGQANHCYGDLMCTETANEQARLRVLRGIRSQLQLRHLRWNEQRSHSVARTEQAVDEHQAAFRHARGSLIGLVCKSAYIFSGGAR